jgi:hypothetical protein
MGIRRALVTAPLAVLPVLPVLLLLLVATGCSADDAPGPPAAEATSDADCAPLLPDGVFTTLGWDPTAEGATATVRGCHREAEQGYVEVRRRRAEQYDDLCATLDRVGTPAPGVSAPWLGPELTACAVEPGADVGTTKVVLRADGVVWQLTVVALAPTTQERVRAALVELVELPALRRTVAS